MPSAGVMCSYLIALEAHRSAVMIFHFDDHDEVADMGSARWSVGGPRRLWKLKGCRELTDNKEIDVFGLLTVALSAGDDYDSILRPEFWLQPAIQRVRSLTLGARGLASNLDRQSSVPIYTVVLSVRLR